jgi:hypothetical protein
MLDPPSEWQSNVMVSRDPGCRERQVALRVLAARGETNLVLLRVSAVAVADQNLVTMPDTGCSSSRW